MTSDYKVPEGLAQRLVNKYRAEIVTDSDSGELDYQATLDIFAERIMLDYDDAKIKKTFGQVIENPEQMSKWLEYNIPELYEILLTINNEL